MKEKWFEWLIIATVCFLLGASLGSCEKGEMLTIRRVGKSGIVDIKGLYKLFPGGPLKYSSKFAGIPKPASCV